MQILYNKLLKVQGFCFASLRYSDGKRVIFDTFAFLFFYLPAQQQFRFDFLIVLTSNCETSGKRGGHVPAVGSSRVNCCPSAPAGHLAATKPDSLIGGPFRSTGPRRPCRTWNQREPYPLPDLAGLSPFSISNSSRIVCGMSSGSNLTSFRFCFEILESTMVKRLQ